MSGDREEQLLLRVQDKALADRIRQVLRENADTSTAPKIEIHFDGELPETLGQERHFSASS